MFPAGDPQDRAPLVVGSSCGDLTIVEMLLAAIAADAPAEQVAAALEGALEGTPSQGRASFASFHNGVFR